MSVKVMLVAVPLSLSEPSTNVPCPCPLLLATLNVELPEIVVIPVLPMNVKLYGLPEVSVLVT